MAYLGSLGLLAASLLALTTARMVIRDDSGVRIVLDM